MPDRAIAAVDLTKRCGEVPAVEGVNIQVWRGEIFGVRAGPRSESLWHTPGGERARSLSATSSAWAY
jgi:hypothetical protein